jgi:hypothetical protein
MTTIVPGNNYLTLINIFTVDQSDQQKLVDLLILARVANNKFLY